MPEWTERGNIKGPPGDVATIINGTTPLVNGQSYIDVIFDNDQTGDWIPGTSMISNTVDASPLIIVPGTVVRRDSSGFRVLLSGAPDSGNYVFNWQIQNATPPPPPVLATTYLLSGPTGGNVGVASTPFTVKLPPNTYLASPVTITPTDVPGAAPSGVFTPASVTLQPANSATFTYTPGSGGAKSISVSNNGGLADPAALTYTPVVAPISPDAITSAVLELWTSVSFEGYTDGQAIPSLNDHSGKSNNIGQPTTAQQPICKDNVINGRPVTRYDGVDDNLFMSRATALTLQPNTIYLLAKINSTGTFVFDEGTGSANRQLFAMQAGGQVNIYAGTNITESGGANHGGAFHLFKLIFNGAASKVFVDGVQVLTGNAGTNGMFSPIFGAGNGTTNASSQDLAETCIFSGLLSSNDSDGLDAYFHNKYGLP
jgi:hypothetical protein